MTAPSPRRTVDWYEPFFDLVFVVVVAVAVHLIEADTSIATVVTFVLLLFPLWWGWVNLTLTNNLYGSSVPLVGGFVVAAMPGPAVMAVAIAGGIAEYAWLYAVGAAWIRLMLLGMWAVPRWKVSSSISVWRLVVYNLVSAGVWLSSILLPAPLNYLLWTVALAGEFALLAVRSRFGSEIYDRTSVSHSLERIGLFIVIVMGEAVYLAVTGLVEHPSLEGGAAALFGFVVCAMLARAFFRWGIPTAEAGLEVAQRERRYGTLRDVVMYLPFLLVIGLTFVAAAIGIAVAHADSPLSAGVRLLLAIGVAAIFLANAVIGWRLGRSRVRVLLFLLPAVVLPALACALSGAFTAWVTLALVALALVALEVLGLAIGRIPVAGSPRAVSAASAPAQPE